MVMDGKLMLLLDGLLRERIGHRWSAMRSVKSSSSVLYPDVLEHVAA